MMMDEVQEILNYFLFPTLHNVNNYATKLTGEGGNFATLEMEQVGVWLCLDWVGGGLEGDCSRNTCGERRG